MDDVLQGFDEFMNVVLDEAEEVWLKETKTKKVGDKATLGVFCHLSTTPTSSAVLDQPS